MRGSDGSNSSSKDDGDDRHGSISSSGGSNDSRGSSLSSSSNSYGSKGADVGSKKEGRRVKAGTRTNASMVDGDGERMIGSGRSRRHSISRIKRLVRQLLIELGEDPDREGLVDTPERVAEMYAEIFSGYTMDSELDVTFTEESDVVVAREIQFYSMCEHHILPFFGKVHIAYIPDGKVFGISKLVRLVEKYAKRLQIQERMTKQIADELEDKVKGVLVVVEGDHMCMRMRGVKNNSKILTIAYRGEFENRELREQILALLRDNSTRMYGI
ncbi:MAG: GTP cyclohydrolase I FolE [Candidatus Nitrosocaldus sp.]|nr:GTP cyclohydrolase I FolE [Candidatus Nitrosocaldus sp.]MDW8001000.1 GTP cyclohydrolase I FolE [Candidatus Nitrosocaldus sp.]